MKTSAFYPQVVFMLFFKFSQQTASILLYRFNQLIFRMRADCVLCHVRTASYKVYTSILVFKELRVTQPKCMGESWYKSRHFNLCTTRL